MAQSEGNLFPFKNILCPNCNEELILSLQERRGNEEIRCPLCKKEFSRREVNTFIENSCTLVSGDCPSCGTSLDFDYELFSSRDLFECIECNESFYLNEVVNPEVVIQDREMDNKRLDFKIGVKGLQLELDDETSSFVYNRLLVILYIEYTLRQLCNIVEDDTDGHLVSEFLTHSIIEEDVSGDYGSQYFKGYIETKGTSNIPLVQMAPVGFSRMSTDVVKEAVYSIYTLQSFIASESTENLDHKKILEYINDQIADNLSMTSDAISHAILGVTIYLNCLKKFFGEKIESVND